MLTNNFWYIRVRKENWKIGKLLPKFGLEFNGSMGKLRQRFWQQLGIHSWASGTSFSVCSSTIFFGDSAAFFPPFFCWMRIFIISWFIFGPIFTLSNTFWCTFGKVFTNSIIFYELRHFIADRQTKLIALIFMRTIDI